MVKTGRLDLRNMEWLYIMQDWKKIGKKLEYEGKTLLAEETKARHEAAITQGKSHRVNIEAQIAKAKELGNIKK